MPKTENSLYSESGEGENGSLGGGGVNKYQPELHETNAEIVLFPIPRRPTKLLIEPAACKSLKIFEVSSRALASLLITERGIGGNWARKRAVKGATLATSLRFSLGEQAKKIPTDKSWDFEYWWCAGNRRQTAHELLKRAHVGWCGLACSAGFFRREGVLQPLRTWGIVDSLPLKLCTSTRCVCIY